jgi:hypothetical protein
MMNRWIGKAVKFCLFIAFMALLVGFLVMTLWNNLIPALFQGPVITFWQALGLLVLTRLLFTGFFRPSGWSANRSGYWRKRWEKKMDSLTPEERDKIRQAYERRCSGRFRNWMHNQPDNKETVAGE